jgi:uncharacterized membrane-anchored protein
MNRQRLAVAVFILIAIGQLAVAASAIVKRELTLRYGEVYRFRTAPVDPLDVFRGRYVLLAFEERTAVLTLSEGDKVERNQLLWATIAVDSDGFARLTSASPTRPDDTPALRCRSARTMRSSGEVWLRLPFNRYYMEESKAPAAEIAYRRQTRQEESNAHVAVRVRDGFAVIEELYLDGMPIGEYLSTLDDEA